MNADQTQWVYHHSTPRESKRLPTVKEADWILVRREKVSMKRIEINKVFGSHKIREMVSVKIPISVVAQMLPDVEDKPHFYSGVGDKILHAPSNSLILVVIKGARNKRTKVLETRVRYPVNYEGNAVVPCYNCAVEGLVTSAPYMDVFVRDFLVIPRTAIIMRWPCDLKDPVTGELRMSTYTCQIRQEACEEAMKKYDKNRWDKQKDGPMFIYRNPLDRYKAESVEEEAQYVYSHIPRRTK